MMILNLIAAALSRPLFLALILAGAGLTLAHFKSAVTKAARTPKCIGDNADKWQVSFDWLVADENNIAKLLEGAYDSRTSQPVRRVSNVESYRAPRHA